MTGRGNSIYVEPIIASVHKQTNEYRWVKESVSDGCWIRDTPRNAFQTLVVQQRHNLDTTYRKRQFGIFSPTEFKSMAG